MAQGKGIHRESVNATVIAAVQSKLRIGMHRETNERLAVVLKLL